MMGFLFERGSVISQLLLFSALFMSVVHIGRILSFRYNLGIVRYILFFVLFMSIYGVYLQFDTTIAEWGHIKKIDFLKHIYSSFFPVFSFYYFTKKELINEEYMKLAGILFLAVTTIAYYQEYYDKISSFVTERTEVTNNVGYTFVMLMPLLYFWRNKLLNFFIGISYIGYFVFAGYKRGAIAIYLLCFCLYIYYIYKESSRKERKIMMFLFVFSILIFCWYFSSVLMESEYAQQRFEKTLDGDSSGRDVILSRLFSYFCDEASLIKILFGSGAYATVFIAGNFAHNEWAEILICQGVFGIVVFVFYLLSLRKKIILLKKYENDLYVVMQICLVIFLVKSFFSMAINGMTPPFDLALGYCLAKKNNPE